MNLTVAVEAPEAIDPGRFGPKAANLAALARAGLPTPGGTCIDASAYRLQLAHLGLEAAARRAASSPDLALARRSALEVRLGLFERPLSPSLQGPLLGAWRALHGAGGAVRSSALVEDRKGSSFAGQFESYLALETEADFLTALRASWAALWSVRALRYMALCNVDPAATAMAVLVQPFVAARASGGGLSRTASGEMLVTATAGPGSAIAQGEVVPDRYLFGRDGVLARVEPGRTEHSARCAHDRPVAADRAKRAAADGLRPASADGARLASADGPRPAAADQAGPASADRARLDARDRARAAPRPCLDVSQACELGRLLRRAEDVLGCAVEIEWVLGNAGLQLLQARPLPLDSAQVAGEPPDFEREPPGASRAPTWPGDPRAGLLPRAIRGQPAGIGQASGRACVVRCECELGRVAPGDVLVTKVAGPGLSAILSTVAGVVAELGGSTSHLASLARERGIPAVLGAVDATARIPDGVPVTVDGASGIVRWTLQRRPRVRKSESRPDGLRVGLAGSGEEGAGGARRSRRPACEDGR